MIKVSIIVAAYNTEKYIKRAVMSVLDQTLKEIEVIVVDDASTDSTPFILDNLAKTDERLKVIKLEENIGQGGARNIALKIAKGDAIMILDADDYLELEACEMAYSRLIERDNDLVKFGINYVDITNKSKDYASLEPFANLQDISFNPKELGVNLFVAFYTCSCIYKKEFLNKFNIVYLDGRLGEDIYFYIKAWINAKSVSVINYFLYNYYRHTSSSTVILKDSYTDSIKIRADMFELVNGNTNLEKAYFYNFANSNIFWFEMYKDSRRSKEYFLLLKKLFKKYGTSRNVAWLKSSNSGLFEKYMWICNESFYNYFRLINNKKKIWWRFF